MISAEPAVLLLSRHAESLLALNSWPDVARHQAVNRSVVKTFAGEVEQGGHNEFIAAGCFVARWGGWLKTFRWVSAGREGGEIADWQIAFTKQCLLQANSGNPPRGYRETRQK
jgi:hypothetical protein